MGSHLGCLLTSLKGAPIVHSSVEHRIEPPKIRWFAMLFIQTSVIGLSNYESGIISSLCIETNCAYSENSENEHSGFQSVPVEVLDSLRASTSQNRKEASSD